jgi:hypothetical protein
MKLMIQQDGTKTPDFTYDEVSAEMKRLDIASYPSDDTFTEEEIVEAVKHLDDYSLSKNVVTFSGPDFTPTQLAAFAKFAEALGKNTLVTHDYNGWVIKRDTSDEERRGSALSHLKSERDRENRKAANASLTSRFKAGDLPEIVFTTEVAY